jgi:DNA-binding CsgD family transcriptional regulator
VTTTSLRDDQRHTEIPLLERDHERTVLSSVVTELSAGRPAVVSVSGRPGYGQGSLLRWVAGLAEDHDLRVLRARATPAERELRYGAVLQLLAPMLGAGGGPLRALVEQRQPHHLPGLSELLVAACARPTLVVVEDTQWLDAASLRWLRALVRRLPNAPLALVVSTSGVALRESDWLGPGAVPQGPVDATELPLSPLTARGVATAVDLVCGTPGDDRFVTAAAEVTAGNPAVLRDTLRGFAERRYPPVADRAPALYAVAASVIGEHASHTLRGLPEEAVTALRALAVCGELFDFRLVCSLAGLRSVREPRLRATLEASGLTVASGDTLRVGGPVVRARVLEDMPADGRSELAARAAELAHRSALPDDDLARLLLRARPVGARWAVLALRRGVAAALRERDYGRASSYLSRALAEPLEPAQRARLSFELAGVQAVVAPEASDRRLGELARSEDVEPALRARAIDLGLARGNADWVRRAAAEALPAARDAEADGLAALFWVAEQTRQDDTELMVPAVAALPDHPDAPVQAGVRGWQLALRGEDPDTGRELARRALAGSDPLVMPRLAACWTLCLTEDWEEAGTHLDALLAQVRPDHARAATTRVLATRADLNLRRGRLAAAASDLAAAERALPRSSWHAYAVPHLTAVRIGVALESGRIEEARTLADAPAPPGADDTVLWSYVLFARAWLAAGDQRWEAAAEWSRESGRRLLRRQWTNPALLPWRSLAARAACMLGDQADAVRLAREELDLASRWGAPVTLGWAEHCMALLDVGEEGLARARAAGRTLRAAPGGLTHTQALTELAAAELASGNRQAAADLLTEASTLPAMYPSSLLAERVRAIAAQVAAPPEADLPAVSGAWAALSEPERRAATLAGQGHGNRDIAEMLAVSTRTVEQRLSAAYRKLDISGRAELCELVQAMEGC